MAIELRRLGLRVDVEYEIEVWYDGQRVGYFRADLLVERCVILEIEASAALLDADRRQTLNYLRGSDLEIGLLLHFGPRPAVRRVVFSNDRKPGRRLPSGPAAPDNEPPERADICDLGERVRRPTQTRGSDPPPTGHC
jgi:GxxExxY protein